MTYTLSFNRKCEKYTKQNHKNKKKSTCLWKALLIIAHMLLSDILQFLHFQTSPPRYLDLLNKEPANHYCKIANVILLIHACQKEFHSHMIKNKVLAIHSRKLTVPESVQFYQTESVVLDCHGHS